MTTLAARRMTGALTPREQETINLLAEGMSNKLIADKLGISEHSAKFHVNGVFKKLGATNRTEAVAIAIKRGLVQLQRPEWMNLPQQLNEFIQTARRAVTNHQNATITISPELAEDLLNYISGANHKPVIVSHYPNQMTGDDDIGA